MSNSSGSQFSKVGLIRSIIVAILFVAVLTVAGWCKQLEYYQQASDQATKHQRWAKDEIERGCPSFGKVSKAECSYQAKQSADEDERAEYDLYAQRSSALWAAIMALAALLGIGLSGVGMYLVWTTFREAKRSADEAERNVEAFISVERAWLEASVSGNKIALGDKRITIFIDVIMRGRTPATVVGIYWNEFGDATFRSEPDCYNFQPQHAICDTHSVYNVGSIEVDITAPFIGGWVSYRINFSGEERKSYFLATLEEAEHDSAGWIKFNTLNPNRVGWPKNT